MGLAAVFGLTVFTGAFLLFQVQPVAGRFLLPSFGGGAGVWTTCLLFFQGMLVAGYGYAHVLSSRFSLSTCAGIHAGVLLASLFSLPILAATRQETVSENAPEGQIVIALLSNLGLVFLLLSSTTPLILGWYSSVFPGPSPYRLYALSNGACILALLSYPFLIEPLLTLNEQIQLWSWAYGGFVAGCVYCALRTVKMIRSRDGAASSVLNEVSPGALTGSAGEESKRSPGLPRVLFWMALAASGSALLLATTNQICQDLPVVPLLWIVPLTLYLLTFVLAFHRDSWYKSHSFERWMRIVVPLALGVLIAARWVKPWVQIVVFCVALFSCAMGCHAELARTRPHPRFLTLFSLAIAVGGVLGAGFVALLAPRFFGDYWEYPIALGGCCLLMMAARYRERVWKTRSGEQAMPRPTAAVVMLLLILVYAVRASTEQNTIFKKRNFYGIVRVSEALDEIGPYVVLTSGQIMHGYQYQEPWSRRNPTGYYKSGTGIGLALEHHPRRHASDRRQRRIRMGVVGLGAGVLATYGRAGDWMRFYEINPDVIHVADRYFSFLRDSAAKTSVVRGDARVELRRELAQEGSHELDILAVDAFTGEATPVHLLTIECVELYRKHLRPDGLLLFHISNRFVNFAPLMRGLARHFGLQAVLVESISVAGSEATWAILTNNREFLETPEVRDRVAPSPDDAKALIWSDDAVSLWGIVEY